MSEPTKLSQKVLRSLLMIAILLGGGAGLGYLHYTMRPEPPRRTAQTLPPLVETLPIEPEDVVERFVGYGTAEPDRRAHMAAEVSARVVELVNDIEAGSEVSESQPLIRLDAREYRHRLEQIEALIAANQAAIDELDAETRSLEKLIKTAEQEQRVAQEEKARVTGLFELGHAAKKEYDFANLAYQRARRVLQGYLMEEARLAPRRGAAVASKQAREAEAQLAGLNLERCKITAPFTGTIETLAVNVGDWVGPGSPLMTLIDPSHVEIPIQLPAGVYNRTHLGAPCRIDSPSAPASVWYGKVARISPSVDVESRTFAAYVDVDNTKQKLVLVPGAFVRAEVEGPTHRARLLVPRGAIRAGHVLVAVDGIARQRQVVVDSAAGPIADRVLVGGALHPGDLVILSHLDRLADGSAVRTSGSVPIANSRGPSTAKPDVPQRTDLQSTTANPNDSP